MSTVGGGQQYQTKTSGSTGLTSQYQPQQQYQQNYNQQMSQQQYKSQKPGNHMD
jgi:hypothetical protein